MGPPGSSSGGANITNHDAGAEEWQSSMMLALLGISIPNFL